MKELEARLKEIVLNNSRNNGDYIPDYNFDSLVSDATRILREEKERIIKIVETQLNGYHKKLEKDEIYACQEILEAIKGANHER